jgi:glycosyltransferase involved in cell wall biosynthesis
MRILFLIPCGRFVPSGAVRVLQHLGRFRERGVRPTVMSYYSPFAHRCRRRERALRARHGGFLAGKILSVCEWLVQWFDDRRTRAVERLLLLLAPFHDVVFLQWVLLPEPLIGKLKATGVPFVFDFDDAVFLKNPERFETTVRNAWKVVAGNRFNLEHASRWNPEAVCIPSAVDMDRFPPPRGRAGTAVWDRVPTIGWIGSGSTVPYLGMLVAPLRELAREGRSIELLVAGTVDSPSPLPAFEGVSVAEVPAYSGDEIPSLVSRMDIGVMPLEDGPWERGKGALKAIVYMAGSVPTVCSRVGEAGRLIRDGENGFLASTPQEWKEKISALLDDPELRRRIGGNGRGSVEEEYSARRCFERMWREVFSLVPGRSRRRDTGESPSGGG